MRRRRPAARGSFQGADHDDSTQRHPSRITLPAAAPEARGARRAGKARLRLGSRSQASDARRVSGPRGHLAAQHEGGRAVPGDQPHPAQRGAASPAPPGARDPGDRARVRQPVRVDGARAGRPEGGFGSPGPRHGEVPQGRLRRTGKGGGDHRLRPRALSRQKSPRRNLRGDAESLRANGGREHHGAHGELRVHRGDAHRVRPAAARGQEAPAPPSLKVIPMPIFYRWVIAVLTCVTALPAHAGEPQAGIAGVAGRKATVNFTDLARQEARAPLAPRTPKVFHSPMPGPKEPGDKVSRVAAQAEAGPAPLSPAPASSFLALADDTTAVPPDTQGAVGPNHLMTVLNTQVRVQTRTGVVLSTVSLDFFWASVGSPSAFDPRIRYDPYGGRWIFVAGANGNSTASAVLIGVSQTSDPTGVWNLFSVDADASNATWADFPSVGFNKDWIVVSTNMFTVGASSSSMQSNIWVFTKASLYNNSGPPSAPFRRFTDAASSTLVPALTYDATLATQYLVDVWNSSSGTLRISTITGAVGAETYTAGTSFPTATSANAWAVTGPDAPQLGLAQPIETGDRRMQSCSYRNASLWCVHHIFLPAANPIRTAVQWWQLTTAGAVQQRGRIDDASGATFYAYPSIAVNANSDVLIGYSRFSASQYASGNYSFRQSCNAANTLQSDTVLKAGEGPYYKIGMTSQKNRWGDYSATVVDPANDLDMWTIQEYAATPVGTGASDGNGRWGTWWGRVEIGRAHV